MDILHKGPVNVDLLKHTILNENEELWDHFVTEGVHSDGKRIPILWSENHKLIRNPIEITIYKNFDKYYKLVNNIIRHLKSIYVDCVPIKIILIKLKPSGMVLPHVDRHEVLTIPHRIHIPIYTNDNVLFSVGSTCINMKEGYIYEINNILPHSVVNNGDTDRIHLLVDMISSKDYDFRYQDAYKN
jgi:hypothetical protein